MLDTLPVSISGVYGWAAREGEKRCAIHTRNHLLAMSLPFPVAVILYISARCHDLLSETLLGDRATLSFLRLGARERRVLTGRATGGGPRESR